MLSGCGGGWFAAEYAIWKVRVSSCSTYRSFRCWVLQRFARCGGSLTRRYEMVEGWRTRLNEPCYWSREFVCSHDLMPFLIQTISRSLYSVARAIIYIAFYFTGENDLVSVQGSRSRLDNEKNSILSRVQTSITKWSRQGLPNFWVPTISRGANQILRLERRA